MPTDLLVRPAEPAESDALADLYGRSRRGATGAMPASVHTSAEDREWFKARLRDGDHEAWVAEADGLLSGYLLLTQTWLDHLFVDPEHQRRGVGTALLDLAKTVRPHGFCLWVFETNHPARTFYAARGLVELERTDGSGNEEQAPDLRMAWPGTEPLGFFRGLIDDVDRDLAGLLARRSALTRAVQDVKGGGSARDPEREREIALAMAKVAPELGADRLARIVHAIITESLDAALGGDPPG